MYILFDIGGTKMRFANSLDGKNLQTVEFHPTPQDFEKAIEIAQKYILNESLAHPENEFCVGLPGVFNEDKDSLVSAPNLPFWIGKPIKKRFMEISKSKVILVNDAGLAALGESIHGAGKNHKIVAYITIGTGIGGARVVDGKIDAARYGFEPGHQIISTSNSTEEILDWEGLVGGVGILKRYSKNPEEITEKIVWDEINHYISIGLVNTIVHWSPDVVVLGGSVARNENVSIQKITEEIKKRLKVFPILPEIKKSSLGEEAGLFGGLAILNIKD